MKSIANMSSFGARAIAGTSLLAALLSRGSVGPQPHLLGYSWQLSRVKRR